MNSTCSLVVRKAKMSDLSQILDIYEYARRFMKETGNPNQWGDFLPPKELLINDIADKKHLYVVVDSKEIECIYGVFAFIIGKDPAYSVIKNGTWLSEELYGTLRRVASSGKIHGIFSQMVSYCRQQISHLRIDTHEDNKIMQHLIEKNGFSKRGIIFKDDGSPRVAFEYVKLS